MDQQRRAQLAETALSFTGVIALGTCLCCTTMSCVALCIKLVTWIFGQRRPRRMLIRHTQEDNSNNNNNNNRVPAYNPLDHHHYHHHHHHHPNSNCAEQRVGDFHTSDVELREIPFRNIEEPLSIENKGGRPTSNRFSTAVAVTNGADDNDPKPTANGLTSEARLTEFQQGDEKVSTHDEDGDDDGDGDGDEEQDSGHGRLGG